jgi:UDPglucose 6-dehydrogenase
MHISVIGTGYVGLVTGACLSHIGHDVICVDNNPVKVEQMQSGQSPIYEPGLAEIMRGAMQAGKLRFTSDLQLAVAHGEVLFIAVGTPPLPDGKTDTQYVEAVARDIGAYLTTGYRVIVNKSTVPIGSAGWVKMLINQSLSDRQDDVTGVTFDVVSNPEFLREGNAIHDTFNPDRIVLGSTNDRSTQLMLELYGPIIDRKYAEEPGAEPVPVLVTDITSAEMIKYAANSFLVVKVSFINEIANICDYVGADVGEVARGIGLDSRIGHKFLQAGIGWGGSCFPKDVNALVYTSEEYGYDASMLKAAMKVNQYQRLKVIAKLQQKLKVIKGKTIGILGLTFKPDTDDLRDAPSLDIIGRLQELGANVKAYDPMVDRIRSSKDLDGIQLTDSVNSLARGCDALIVVTEWAEFKKIDFEELGAAMSRKLIIDGRNFLDREQVQQGGFEYYGIGR